MPETIKRPLKSLVKLASNPRQITADDLARLQKSIEDNPDYFIARPLILSDRTGELVILAGNMRYEAARKLKLKEVPTFLMEGLTEEREREIIIRDNVNNGTFDWDCMANEWSDLPLSEWGVDIPDDWAGAEEGGNEGLTDADEVPEDAPTRCKAGQLWMLGEHRVLCGDSTKAADVARLMDGNLADIGFTSPPYCAEETATGGYKGSKVRKDREPLYKHYDDTQSSAEYVSFLLRCLLVTKDALNPQAPLLWNVAYNAKSRNEYGAIVFSENNPLPVRETIVWDKGVGMNIATKGILSRTCEFIFLMCSDEDYFTNQGKNEVFWNVWRISNRGGGNQENNHGASFPVDLPKEGIVKFSPTGAIAYDPFLGSGTTLIAAEQTGRKCFGIEISEKYCDVILERWEAFSGGKAELVE